MNPLSISNELHGNPSKEPQFKTILKDLKGETQSVVCPQSTRALVSLMDMQAVLGGAASHFGGPAAFAEMMSATHALMFKKSSDSGKQWHEMFHFVNDAGHCENGIYALKANYELAGLNVEKLKGFRSIESGLTGHGEAHLFPESVYISNGPLGSGLPQAQGLAAAESFSDNPRTTITAISDGGCMEGEAKEALAAIPGLASKGKLGPFLCMVSDNNTKLSGRIDDDAFSMKPSFESLETLGWEVTYIEDGHNLEQVYQSIEKSMEKLSKDSKKPQLLWMKTIKGKGVKSTEESASGGHGFPLKKPDAVPAFVQEIYEGKEIPQPIQKWTEELLRWEKPNSSDKMLSGNRTKVQTGVAKALIDKFKEGYPVISISADLQGSTGVAAFRKEFPKACFEVGVAESNMVSMGIGLSKQGYIPVVDTFSQFGVTKGALPLIMSGLSKGPVIGIFSHTGFQDAADGASHQAITYFAKTAAIPNVDVYALSCSEEAYQLVGQAVENFAADRKAGKVPRSSIFFLGRETYLEKYGDVSNYKLGEAQVVSDTTAGAENSVTILAVSSLLENAMIAQEELKKDGIGSIVVHPSMINHPDMNTILPCLEKTNGCAITIEDHRDVGGFGTILSQQLMTNGMPVSLRTMGIGDGFGRSAYKSQQLYDNAGLGVKDIVETAKALCSEE